MISNNKINMETINKKNASDRLPRLPLCLLLAGMLYPWPVDARQPANQWTFDVPESGDPFDSMNGVSGKALVFDGYRTEISQKPDSISVPGGAFTITAWIAPQEYSWNRSAIVNQQADPVKGFFFGIDHAGCLVARVGTEAGLKSCISTESLPLLKWSHVAMVFDATQGIFLYLDGKRVGESLFLAKMVPDDEAEITLGKTQIKMSPANTERKISRDILSWMFFDGLMDEVQIDDKALTAEEIQQSFAAVQPSVAQPLEFRRLPSGPDEPRPFGAYMTRLSFSPGWDRLWQGSELPDIVVRFDDNPVKLVFWRGASYFPAMVTENGIWMTDQSMEQWGGGQCWEMMGDKDCRYSHVRLIENNAARVVVHWRYPLASIKHEIWAETETYPGDWGDEYWTAWPDGVVARKQVLWTQTEDLSKYQFQETIFLNQPGARPQDTVENEALTFMDMNGRTASYSWKDGAPKEFSEPAFMPVEMVNTKSHYRPFSIHHPERVTRPFSFGWIEGGYSTFPSWNHWPVSQIPNDGRMAVAPDKASHSSLAAVDGGKQKIERFSDGSVWVRSLIGMTTEPIESLLPLARSWNNPPKVKSIAGGYEEIGYDAYQRAYVFRKRDGTKQPLNFELIASEQSPVVNLPIVIQNWGLSPASVEVNGQKRAEGEGFTQGHPPGLNSQDLILWIPLETASTVKVRIE